MRSLPSLLATDFPSVKIVISDDRSTDDSISYVRTNFPQISILQNQRRQGFAGAVNTGLDFALSGSYDYVAIANNDIQVHPHWAREILQAFQYGPKPIGIVGFREILRQNEEIFFSYGASSAEGLNLKEVSAIPGCFYVCSAKLFRTIGFFDELYYMYGEDNDIFYRTRKLGFAILQSDFPVWHYGEGSSNETRMTPTWLAYRNALRFSIKNESIFGNIRMVLALLHQGCNPFALKRVDNPNYKRLRRFNPLMNLGFIIGSVFWNLWHLNQTLTLRKVELNKVGV